MRLHKRDSDGSCLADHLTAAAERGIEDAAERLAEAYPPEDAAYLSAWFWELKRAAPRTGMGSTVIQFGEVEAWCRLHSRTLSPWELATIQRMDEAFNNAQDEDAKKTREAATKSRAGSKGGKRRG